MVLRLAPLALDPAPALKTIDGDVEGTLQDFEALAGNLLDAQQDAVAMQRTERDRLEYTLSPFPSRRLPPGSIGPRDRVE